ncbi:MAG: 5-(carboxyamino)imidazole ribonucleotide synthase [Pirellulaceae bacterium]|nr:5-(carboxyamino)imidazole ribonucleotide synthase [Pirellulaceae bacterium]
MPASANTPSPSTSTLAAQSVQPGSWLGVLGGGQLGRMFTQAAQRLGYQVAIYESEPESPAAQLANRNFCPSDQPGVSPEALVQRMAHLCDVVTLEFENIPASMVRAAADHCLTHPCAEFLELCQDRKREKQSLSSIGCPTTPFTPVTSQSEAAAAGAQLGWPVVLKTACSGYDGKGQCLVRAPADLPAAWNKLNSDHVVAEKWIDFVAEVSMLTARNAAGQIVHYPLFENQHSHHILDVTHCPVRPELLPFQEQATEICRHVAQSFSVVGLFCIEFFVSRDGRLLINEIAPRPHNSGHLTIEAFDISQFEMQVRAICNLPLRTPRQLSPAAMANLLGDLWRDSTPNWNAVLELPQTFLHLYGKSEARSGRKMGHITVLDDYHAATLAQQARAALIA